ERLCPFVCACVCVCVCVCLCVYACMCVCVCVCEKNSELLLRVCASGTEEECTSRDAISHIISFFKLTLISALSHSSPFLVRAIMEHLFFPEKGNKSLQQNVYVLD